MSTSTEENAMPLKPITLLCIAFCLASGAAQSQQCALLPAEQNLVLDESVIAIGVRFDVYPPSEDDAEPPWSLEQEIFSWGNRFVLRAADGAVAASCAKRVLAWSATTDVLDCRGDALLTIREKWAESLFKIVTNYSVYDPDEQLVMASRKVEGWLSGTEMTFTRDDRPVGRAERDWPAFWGDTWRLSTTDRDPRAMLTLICAAAHKTLRDHQASSESSGD